MSGRNWTKVNRLDRMARHGTEERDNGGDLPPITGPRRAPVVSKEELRRQADELLRQSGVPVTKVPAGITGKGVIRSHVSGARTQTLSGNVARSGVRTAPSKSKGKKGRGKGKRFKPGRFSMAPAAPDVSVGLVVYCDGACEPNPGAGGWGFVVYQDGVETHADCGGADPATNNIMELTGALMALRWIAEHLVEKQDGVRLLCDSQYVVKGCNEWRHAWKRNGWNRRKPNSPKRDAGEVKNLELWKQLDEALTAVPITLEWCKGHAGIEGNERADELSLIGREKTLEAADPLTAEYRAIMAGMAA